MTTPIDLLTLLRGRSAANISFWDMTCFVVKESISGRKEMKIGSATDLSTNLCSGNDFLAC